MLEKSKTWWQSGKERLSFKTSKSKPELDGESLEERVRQLEEAVAQDTLAALRGSSDLPAEGGRAAVLSLLRRYLTAEKGSVEKAAARLVKQAEWRQEFGRPVPVSARRLCQHHLLDRELPPAQCAFGRLGVHHPQGSQRMNSNTAPTPPLPSP